MDSTQPFRFVVDTSTLGPKFGEDKAERPRLSSIYDPPLVLVKESPGEDRHEGRALLCFQRVAYTSSFYGYSAFGYAEGELLVRYLNLFIHSDTWLYYALLTSPKFGAERRTLQKADLDQCPIPPFDALTDRQRAELSRLSSALETGVDVPWDDIDAFFAALYGLREHELQVMRDTLAVGLPYASARERACRPATGFQKRAFLAALRRSVAPLVAPEAGKLVTHLLKLSSPDGGMRSPFDVLILATEREGRIAAEPIADDVLSKIISIADETGASQIVLSEPGYLLVGIYNQYRYWTSSRARLLACDIIRYYIDAITG